MAGIVDLQEGVEDVAADEVVVQGHVVGNGKQGTDNGKHFVGILLLAGGTVDGMEEVEVERYLCHCFVRLWVGLIAVVHGTVRTPFHLFVFGMRGNGRLSFFQSLVQEAVHTRIGFRQVLEESVEGGGDELRNVFRYIEMIGLAPFGRFLVFAYGAETPVPRAILQYGVRVKHTPGKRFGLYGLFCGECLVLRQLEL